MTVTPMGMVPCPRNGACGAKFHRVGSLALERCQTTARFMQHHPAGSQPEPSFESSYQQSGVGRYIRKRPLENGGYCLQVSPGSYASDSYVEAMNQANYEFIYAGLEAIDPDGEYWEADEGNNVTPPSFELTVRSVADRSTTETALSAYLTQIANKLDDYPLLDEEATSAYEHEYGYRDLRQATDAWLPPDGESRSFVDRLQEEGDPSGVTTDGQLAPYEWVSESDWGDESPMSQLKTVARNWGYDVGDE